jgi:hypothetical protein
MSPRIAERRPSFPPPPSRPKSGSRNARVAALQERWDRLRAGLDLILTSGARTWLICPASGLRVRGYKGKEADDW